MRIAFLLFLATATLLFGDTVKVGVILPLTGNTAEYGQMCYRGVQLFMHELKSRKTRHNYEFIIEDDQLTPRLTAAAVHKLTNVDNVHFLLSTTATSGNVINPVAQRKGIPHFGITSDPNVSKGSFNFVHWTPPSQQAIPMVKACEALNYRKIALVYMRQQASMHIMQEFKKAAAGKLKFVSDIVFNPGERDFRTILQKTHQSEPDLIIVLTWSPELDIILNKLKEMQIETPVTSFEMFDMASNRSLVEGKWFVNGAAERPEYMARMANLLPDQKATYSGYFYDALELMLQAYERQDTPDPAAATAWIAQQVNFPSQVGTGKLTVGKDGLVQTTASYYTIQNGIMTPTTLSDILEQ